MKNKFKVEVPDAFDTFHENHYNKNLLKRWDYCETDSAGQPESIYCKHCGDKIAGMRDFGDPETYISEDEPRTMVVRQRVKMLPYDNYQMVALDMDDAGQHITVCCKTCAPALLSADAETLHAVYVADLQSLTDTAASKEDMSALVHFHSRKPVEAT